MKVIITTEDIIVGLEEMFIGKYIKNINSNSLGELTFEMLISGEAGLTIGFNYFIQHLLGTKFYLLFLIKVTDATNRLL